MSQVTVRPTGEGTNEGLGGYGAAHCWETVSDDSDGTYVYTSITTYGVDTYVIADPSIPADAIINSVAVKVRVSSSNTGTNAYSKSVLYIGSALYYGDENIVTSTSPEDKTYTWTSNPAGGSWTVADVNALEAGVALKATSPRNSICTEVYVIVDYSLPGYAAPLMW